MSVDAVSPKSKPLKSRARSPPNARPSQDAQPVAKGTPRACSRTGPRAPRPIDVVNARPGSGDSARYVGRPITEKTKAQNLRTTRGSNRTSSGTDIAQRSGHGKEMELDPVLVIDRETEEVWRQKFVSALQEVPNFHPEDDARSFHGRASCLAHVEATTPRVVWKSTEKPRKNSPDWLTATEYHDTPEVFSLKISLLARLLKASRHTLAYTGAGLSVAAGIGMAAVGSTGGGGMGVAAKGEPTLSHCVMAELNRQNLLHGWVQQNHDGLPQKAGYRQEDINEIHGSWFDPSNPVVKYSGSLRGDLFEDMERLAATSDLVLVLGTSLTGLNADQCVTKTANRSREGRALGSVIISPQRTAQDGKASLRIFAKSDEVMRALAEEMNFGRRGLGQTVKRSVDLFMKADRVLVPYDKEGKLSTSVKTHWDLSRGQKVRIGINHNIRGAKQPNDNGITEETIGTVTGREPATCSFSIQIGGTTKRLGVWWLETAARGGLPYLPIVNVNAKEIHV